MSRAEAQARRLLAAYPWRVRAEQGDEIVGTALDALPLVVDKVTTLEPHRLHGLVLVDWADCAVIGMEPFGKTVLRPRGR